MDDAILAGVLRRLLAEWGIKRTSYGLTFDDGSSGLELDLTLSDEEQAAILRVLETPHE